MLVKKGFVDFKAFGKTHQYFPIITKTAYRKFLFDKLVGNYFSGSYKNLVSTFVKEKELGANEISELLNEIEKNK